MEDTTKDQKDEKIVTPIQADKTGVQPAPEPNKETSEEKAIREKAEKEEKEKAEKKEDTTAEDKDDSTETATDIKEDVVEEKIEIDGVVYNLDAQGNAILNGKIAYDKAAVDKMLEDNKDDTTPDGNATIESISTVSGIVPVDEAGNPIVYEMSVEGLAKRESDIYNIGKSEGFEEGFTQFLQANPDIADVINYKRSFGTIEGFTSNVDYNKYSLPDNDDELYQLIIKAEIQKGTSPERAKRFADFAKNNNSLKEDAEESLNYLRGVQEAKIKEIQQQQEEANRKAREQDVRFYGIDYDNKGNEIIAKVDGSVYDMIMTKGEVKGYTIPIEGINIRTEKGARKVSRRELFDYIAKPVYQDRDGTVYTQAQLDEIAIGNNPQEYVLRCISNLDGGIESLVKKAIGEKQVVNIRKISSTKNRSKGSGQKDIKNEGNDKPTLVLPVTKQN